MRVCEEGTARGGERGREGEKGVRVTQSKASLTRDCIEHCFQVRAYASECISHALSLPLEGRLKAFHQRQTRKHRRERERGFGERTRGRSVFAFFPLRLIFPSILCVDDRSLLSITAAAAAAVPARESLPGKNSRRANGEREKERMRVFMQQVRPATIGSTSSRSE